MPRLRRETGGLQQGTGGLEGQGARHCLLLGWDSGVGVVEGLKVMPGGSLGRPPRRGPVRRGAVQGARSSSSRRLHLAVLVETSKEGRPVNLLPVWAANSMGALLHQRRPKAPCRLHHPHPPHRAPMGPAERMDRAPQET